MEPVSYTHLFPDLLQLRVIMGADMSRQRQEPLMDGIHDPFGLWEKRLFQLVGRCNPCLLYTSVFAHKANICKN